MSDDDKKRIGDSSRVKGQGSEELKKHEQEQQRQREEWAKIEKRGAGAGDRPKK